MAPAAVSEARWGQSLIYCPKMQKYARLMGYSPAFIKKLKRFNTFGVVYIPYWLVSNSAADCQVNDLRHQRDLEALQLIDSETATAALEVFGRHLDYLAAEWSFVSLVSKKVSVEEKKNLAHAILQTANPTLESAPLKPVVEISSATSLAELVRSPRVNLIFQLLNIDRSILSKDVSEWEDDSHFQKLARYVRNLRVVNDVAENAIQLATDFRESVTRNEEQRQYLYHTVANQRRERGDLRRKSLQPSSVGSSKGKNS